jgi:hypothetical protein
LSRQRCASPPPPPHTHLQTAHPSASEVRVYPVGTRRLEQPSAANPSSLSAAWRAETDFPRALLLPRCCHARRCARARACATFWVKVERFGRGILKLCVHVQSPSAHPHTPRTPPHAAHLRACTHVYAPECTCARVRTHGPVTCPCATALSCTCTHPCTNICARMHAHMCVGGHRTPRMPNSWVLQCRDGSRPNGSLCRPYIQIIRSYLACLHV